MQSSEQNNRCHQTSAIFGLLPRVPSLLTTTTTGWMPASVGSIQKPNCLLNDQNVRLLLEESLCEGGLPWTERPYSAAGLSLEASWGQTHLCLRGTWERKVSWLGYFTLWLERVMLASLMLTDGALASSGWCVYKVRAPKIRRQTNEHWASVSSVIWGEDTVLANPLVGRGLSTAGSRLSGAQMPRNWKLQSSCQPQCL